MGQGAIIDANTFAHWGFDEAQGSVSTVCVDSTGGGRDLTFGTSGTGTIYRYSPGLIGSGSAIIWPNAIDPCRVGRTTDSSLAGVFTGSYTVEFWMMRTAVADAMNIITHSKAIADYPKTSVETHDLLIAQFAPDGTLNIYWTNPLDGSLQVTSSSPVVTLGSRFHVAFRKTVDPLDSSLCTVDFFFNGVPDLSVSSILNTSTAPNAGISGSLWIGAYSDNYEWPMLGVLDDIRLSNAARSDAEILETYTRGISVGSGSGGGGGGGGTPTVTLVSPAEGPISRDVHAIFNVTDSETLLRVIVAAQYESGVYEVIHDGNQFAANFVTSSTRSSITGGYHYVVMRDGGWPENFTIRVFASDVTGVEA